MFLVQKMHWFETAVVCMDKQWHPTLGEEIRTDFSRQPTEFCYNTNPDDVDEDVLAEL